MSRSSMNVNGMNNALAGCVASLQDSNRLLESSIAILDSGVHDFPRMKKVLQTTRVCPFPSHFPSPLTPPSLLFLFFLFLSLLLLFSLQLLT